MALRLLSRQLRPVQSLVRFASHSHGTPAPSAPAGPGVTGRIPDEAEQATGIEKKELNELLKGNDDPFGLSGMKYGSFGTKAAPREIPTHFDSRLVGCCCEEDSEHIQWFEIKKGGPQQCPCPRRQWFKLVPAAEVSH